MAAQPDRPVTVALPQPPVAKLTGWDAIRRGLANLRANWQLVLMYFAQTVVVTVVTVAGFLVPLFAVGLERWDDLGDWDPSSGADPWTEVLALLAELGTPFVLGLLGAAVVWCLALVLLSWFQGGFYGVLAAGDRQAVPGRVVDWRAFRTFSLANFSGWGVRFLWRYFWFWNLFGLVVLAWMVLAVGLVFGAIWGAERYGEAAAVGIGCGGALPLVFLIFVVSLWAGLAAAHLGQEGSRVGLAARDGMRVLGARIGAILLIFLLFFVASFALSAILSVVFLPLTFGSALVFEERFAIYVAVQAVSYLVQLALSSVLATALAAVYVALVRSEAPR